ncbi:DUF349 domain-containing protein [Georgenia sp. SYP-B2076]|uniref:DUF349 domain-containing protein n=1 Tax=Georgenia sp. SYP-B2076 TaxID=2495881 RepID=UPI001F0B7830|nr:DUF349 domain-containing protein [Georgenia sp. SYP-B2076]
MTEQPSPRETYDDPSTTQTEVTAPADSPAPETAPAQGEAQDRTDVPAVAEASVAPAQEAAVPPAEPAPLPPAEEAAVPPAEPAPLPPAEEAAVPPAEPAPAPAAQAEPAPAPAAQAEPAPAPAAQAEPGDARPAPRPTPRPVPRPRVPGAAGGAAQTPVPPAVTAPPVDAHDAAEAAAWGRVDDDGTVWVREATGERVVGQYPGADTEEALGFYVRRFLDLQAQVALFEARLPQIAGKEIDQTLATLTEALEAPTAVGDIDGLRSRLELLRAVADQRREQAAAEREAARAEAVAERTAIVEKAEKIAAQDGSRTQWKQSGERLRELLDAWKTAQRSGPRLDRATEDSLWKRFSHARTAFDRHRRQYFSDLDASQASIKDAKEKLIARAEELSTSTDWSRTATAYRQLMDEWKAAGRASRKDDDALWARFRAAQQKFFDARSALNAEVDAEFGENLKVKLALLEEAEALLPVTDVKAAKAALRPIQERWEEAGKVPRNDVQRVEGRMRAVEQAVRDADQAVWQRSNPEKRARAEGAVAQLESVIATLETELEEARDSGDEKRISDAQAALEARRAWLAQVQRTAQG